MENEKVNYLINMINDMDIKDKLRLAICMSQSEWSGLIYNTKENYKKFDNMLKSIDEEYRTTLINFGKYKLVMFAMAKLMEMKEEQQNQVALYLFNHIKQLLSIEELQSRLSLKVNSSLKSKTKSQIAIFMENHGNN